MVFQLARHMKVHTEKSYQCKDCDKVWSSCFNNLNWYSAQSADYFLFFQNRNSVCCVILKGTLNICTLTSSQRKGRHALSVRRWPLVPLYLNFYIFYAIASFFSFVIYVCYRASVWTLLPDMWKKFIQMKLHSSVKTVER